MTGGCAGETYTPISARSLVGKPPDRLSSVSEARRNILLQERERGGRGRGRRREERRDKGAGRATTSLDETRNRTAILTITSHRRFIHPPEGFSISMKHEAKARERKRKKGEKEKRTLMSLARQLYKCSISSVLASQFNWV